MMKTDPAIRPGEGNRVHGRNRMDAAPRILPSGESFSATLNDSPGEPAADRRSPESSPAFDERPPRECSPQPWLIWQLADSAFPTGGFAHSAGLEAAWQHGEVRGSTTLMHWLEISLQQLEHGVLPFLNAAHQDPERLPDIDGLCDAFNTNHVANRSSRLQGRAFLTAAQRVFINQPHADPPRAAHLPVVFGAVTRSLGIDLPMAARLFVFLHLRGVVAAAVRLNIIGPLEAQAIQFRLSSLAESVSVRGAILGLDDLAQTAPLHELWQGAQDRLYSRLFQS
jgi:urease accessory protein